MRRIHSIVRSLISARYSSSDGIATALPAYYVVRRQYIHAKSCESLQTKSKDLIIIFKTLGNLLAGPASVQDLGKLLTDVIVGLDPDSSLLGQLARPTESGIAKIAIKNEQLALLGERRPRLDERF